MVKDEYLATHRRLVWIKLRALLLEQRRLIPLRRAVGTRHLTTSAPLRLYVKNLLARGGVACGYEFLQSEPLEVLGEEARELAPFWIVARKQHRLASERIGIEVEVGVDLLLDVGVLCVELVVLCTLGLRQLSVFTHNALRSAAQCS